MPSTLTAIVKKMVHRSAVSIGTLLVVLAIAGCGESRASQAQIDDAIEKALAASAQTWELRLSAQAELEQTVAEAIEELGKDEAITVEEIREIARRELERISESRSAAESQPVDDRPVDSSELRVQAPDAYTRHVVDSAIALYDARGLAETLRYVNDPANIDGQWYVFIIDGSGDIVGHYEPSRRGLPLTGWVGTDINGYNFAPQMLDADEYGRWVPLVYKNPVSGSLGDEQTFQLKNTWVVRHDGLLFASGWHIDSDSFLTEFIAESADRFREGGIEAILDFYNDPTGVSVGLIPMASYYNSTAALDGYFTGIIASPGGEILAHFDPSLIGTDIEDLLGPAYRSATSQGTWITTDDIDPVEGAPEAMRFWAVDVNGTFIGGGWYRPTSR